MIYALTDVPGGRWAWEEVPRYNMKSFCNLGIRLIQIDLAFDHLWKEDGTLVLDTAQRQLKGVLDICPDAAIFIRLHVNPPKWWQKKFHEENTVYADHEPKPDISWGLQRIIEDDEETPARFSLASEKWKTEASEKLKEFLLKLKDIPEANSLVGIQVASGVYGEWHYWGFLENEPDMSKPMKNYFSTWLKEKYKTDKALQKAWNSKTTTLATATLPTLTERIETKAGIFRNPELERNVIDYYEAQHQVVADDILLFCKVIKKHWPRPIITGAFYGYFYSLFGRDAAGGHLQLQRVLSSPYIDYLSGPGTYYPNAVEMGEPYRSRSLINSISLHGKLWLDEMDQQTPLLPLKDKNYAESVIKSVAQVKRNVMFPFSKGHGLWFYDFGPSGFNGGPRLNDHGSLGWWDEPTVRETIRQLKQIGDAQLRQSYRTGADVLLVHDTESLYQMGSDKKSTGITHWGNNWPTVGIFKSGVVHDVIHLADLDKIDLTPYKAIVFVNSFLIRADQKKIIQEKVAKNNRHLIWLYAPGYNDGKKLSTLNMSETIGIQLQKTEPSSPVSITLDSSIVKDYTFSVWNAHIAPLFIVQDTDAESWGVVTGTSNIGMAKKKLKESTSWFIALPPDNPVLWRRIFTDAGANIYNNSGDIFYSGNGILTVHTKNGGARKIKLANGKSISIDLPANSTTLLDSENGAVILK
ncbi:MAG: beta-galactosidase [Chryseolinea sp.]